MQNTINDYIAKVRMRGRRTLLVEGASDKRLMHAILHSRPGDVTSKLVIDSAEQLKSDPGVVLGNREKVEVAHSRISDRKKFGAFVDREYRDFDFAPHPCDLLGAHKIVDDSCFWTKGHSFENYLFRSIYYEDLVRTMLPDKISQSQLLLFRTHFEDILAIACTFSLFFAREPKGDRLRGAFDFHHWDSALVLKTIESEAYLISVRGFTSPEASHFLSFYANWCPIFRTISPELRKQFAHGHITERIILTLMAALLQNIVPIADCKSVQSLSQNVANSILVSNWIRAEMTGGEFPFDLLSWIEN